MKQKKQKQIKYLCLWCGKNPTCDSFGTEVVPACKTCGQGEYVRQVDVFDTSESNICKKCSELKQKSKGETYNMVNIYQSV